MNIPLPQSEQNQDDIFNYGFDGNLNRSSEINSINEIKKSYSTEPLIIEKNTPTGIQNMFSVIQSGENEGDVVTGDYDGGNGALWDKSAGLFKIAGDITATSGKFGTTTNYWSVGATGLTATSSSTDVIINYGKTDFTNTDTGFIVGYDYSASAAKVYIGDSTHYFNWTGTTADATGFRYLNTIVAGETIAVGDMLCMGSTSAGYADWAVTNDVYTVISSGSVVNNTELWGDATEHGIYIRFTVPASPPAVNDILYAELTLFVKSFMGNPSTFTVNTSGADWDYSTYATRPAVDDILYNTCGETNTASFTSSTTSITIDVTQYVRQLVAANINNYGFNIGTSNSAANIIKFHSSSNGDSSLVPRIRVWSRGDTRDKALKADSSSYLRSRSILGVAVDAGNANDTIRYQPFGVNTDFSGLSKGERYYLSTSGGITLDPSISNRIIFIGKATSVTGLLLTPQSFDIAIEKSAHSIHFAANGTKKIYFPADTRYVVFSFVATAVSSDAVYSGILRRSNFVLADANGPYYKMWDTSSVGQVQFKTTYLEITNTVNQVTDFYYTFYN
jgi:hypothetical protein